jgi:hypothetical protein
MCRCAAAGTAFQNREKRRIEKGLSSGLGIPSRSQFGTHMPSRRGLPPLFYRVNETKKALIQLEPTHARTNGYPERPWGWTRPTCRDQGPAAQARTPRRPWWTWLLAMAVGWAIKRGGAALSTVTGALEETGVVIGEVNGDAAARAPGRRPPTRRGTQGRKQRAGGRTVAVVARITR